MLGLFSCKLNLKEELMKHHYLFILYLFFFISCESRQPVQYLQSEKFAKQNMPFSEAVQVGNMLYLSGQVGNIPGEMNVVSGELVRKRDRLWKILKKFWNDMVHPWIKW